MTDSERNFARYTLSYWYKHPEEQKSIVQEHVARIRQGVDVWNTFDQAFADYLKKNNIKDGLYAFIGAELSSVNFRYATFSGSANFRDATFGGNAYFRDATFGGNAYFRDATFKGYAAFTKATFGAKVSFKYATFKGKAHFWKATFNGEASFIDATFSGEADFNNATFKSRCSFYQAESEKNVPNFIGAQFETAPLIEGFKIPWVVDSPEDTIEAYRQLKKFAIEGANHEQEIRFFGFETRCKMHLKHTPILTKAFIGLYWVFSNFGQSLLRPLGALVLVWIVATAMTISTTMKSPIPETLVSLITFEHLEPCEAIPSNAFRSKLDAIRSQSIGSSLTLPVIAMDKDTQHQRNQCLYGQGGGVPETNRIINGIQQVLSLIFLFLFGLAVRNRFKIK